MGKTLPENHIPNLPTYQHVLPKSAPKSHLPGQPTTEVTQGKMLAHEVAERLRAAHTLAGELAVTPVVESTITEEERTVYITNPGHVPYLEN